MLRSRVAAGLPLELGLLCRLPRSYRCFTTTTTPSSSSSSPAPASSPFLDFDQLPCFPVRGKDLKVLYEPQDFYSTLLKGIKKAKKRIFLASLYIGKEETELVRACVLAMKARELITISTRSKLYTPLCKRTINLKSISYQTIFARRANILQALRAHRLSLHYKLPSRRVYMSACTIHRRFLVSLRRSFRSATMKAGVYGTGNSTVLTTTS